MMNRTILHCKINNFYISFHEAQDTTLRTRALCICDNGIVIAVNNNAQKCGISLGDNIDNVKIKAPDAKITSAQYSEYKKADQTFYDICLRYSHLCEYAGPGECFIDITPTTFHMYPSKVAQNIISEVNDCLGTDVTVGISFNKLLAQVASITCTQNMQILTADTFREVLWDLPIYQIPGITRQLVKKLNRNSIFTIKDIAMLSQNKLQLICGIVGNILWEYACGYDIREVTANGVNCDIKSIGEGFSKRQLIDCYDDVRLILLILAQKLSKKLIENNTKACSLQIVIRNEESRNEEFTALLCNPTQNPLALARHAYKVFHSQYNWHSDIASITIKATDIIHSTSNPLVSTNVLSGGYFTVMHSDDIASLAHDLYSGITYSTIERSKDHTISNELKAFSEFFAGKSC